MRHKGFTLVELIVVIAVIGALAAVLIPIISGAINKAHEKSALSDAKNTLTTISAASQSKAESCGDIVITVLKHKSLYVYGWFNDAGELKSSLQNAYDFDPETDKLPDFLSANNCITSDSVPVDITNKMPDPLPSVNVYSNCRLADICESIEFYGSKAALYVGERYDLKYKIAPYENESLLSVCFESSNTDILDVSDDGTVTAKKEGSAVITVTYGNAKATCEITVTEWIDFDGNFAELKMLVEDNESEVLLLRVVRDIHLEDYPDIFPIAVPEGKIVRVDLNGHFVQYFYSDAGGEIYAMFVNDGGYFTLECNNIYETGYISASKIDSATIIDNSIYDCTILNTNNGFAYITSSVLSSGNICSVRNANGILYIDKYATLFTNTSNQYGILNEQQGVLYINNSSNISGIKNYGTIAAINNGTIYHTLNDCLIMNYGTIDRITGGTFISSSGNNISHSCAIKCSGSNAVINSITGGVFNASDDYLSNEETVYVALDFEKGSTLISISDGIFNGRENAIIADKSSTVDHSISGGTYSQKLPDNMLANGYSCIDTGSGWAVKPIK